MLVLGEEIKGECALGRHGGRKVSTSGKGLGGGGYMLGCGGGGGGSEEGVVR